MHPSKVVKSDSILINVNNCQGRAPTERNMASSRRRWFKLASGSEHT